MIMNMSEEIDLKPSMTELRNGFKEYLQKQGMSNVTITQSCSYAFYLWKHGTKNMFWTVTTMVKCPFFNTIDCR